jgi:1-acyl-sn-glycerol-3-phosphate acyltransferase
MRPADPKQLPRRDPVQSWTLRTLVAAGRLYARNFHRVEILAPPRLPEFGPAILVCNHTSGLDPVLIQSVCKRLAVWMMAKEYYDLAALKRGFDLVQAIPVERSGKDLAATRAALRALAAGRVLALFPEGRIETTNQLLPFHTGAAMMAHRTGARVFPAYLDGSQRGSDMVTAFTHPHSATLTFGPPVELSFAGQKPDLSAATAQIQAAVEALRISVSSLHTIA